MISNNTTIDVIVPVGPGHEDLADRARLSVAAAYEACVDWRPKVGIVLFDDTKGALGRSAVRNRAARESSADWIFWLDADDMMHPAAFVNARDSLADHDAVWGTVREMLPGTPYLTEVFEVQSIRAYRTLLRYPPTWTVKIGHFVRREVALRYPFAEMMDCGEDFDYYLRIWQHERCVKIPAPFYIKIAGQHSSGPRSATGAQWSEVVEAMLERARRGESTVVAAA